MYLERERVFDGLKQREDKDTFVEEGWVRLGLEKKSW